MHALQIAREALSNALRHGAANTIHIIVQARGPSVEFEVSDDGAGFDPAASTGPGKGLANFAQRAQELGAELTVQSSPGGGARDNLIFSLIML